MKILLKLLLLCGIYGLVHADKYCMDNSKHMDTSDGYDYKKYYHVNDCFCPCNRYQQSYNRGRCERCWHYRAPQNLETLSSYDARFE